MKTDVLFFYVFSLDSHSRNSKNIGYLLYLGYFLMFLRPSGHSQAREHAVIDPLSLSHVIECCEMSYLVGRFIKRIGISS